jgi:hypothetical protein
VSEQPNSGQDPIEVEPTDNSSSTPVDLNQVEEVEHEAKEPRS